MFCAILLRNLTSGCHIYSQDSNRGRSRPQCKGRSGSDGHSEVGNLYKAEPKGEFGKEGSSSMRNRVPRLASGEQSGFLGVFLTEDALKTSFDDFCLSFVGVFSFPREMKPTGKVGMCECGYDS